MAKDLVSLANEIASQRAAAKAAATETTKPVVLRKPEESTADMIGAGVEAAGAGLLGAVTAIPQLGLAAASTVAAKLGATNQAQMLDEARESLGGRQLVESAVNLGMRAALPADAADEAMREWRQRARAKATQYSGVATAGEIAGGMLGLGASGIGTLGKAAAGAVGAKAGAVMGAGARGFVEGAAFGAAGADDAAWISERQLAGEQVLASAGLSGLLGGGLSMAGTGAIKGIKAGKEGVVKLIGRTGKAEETIQRANDKAVSRAIVAATGEEAAPKAAEFARDIVSGKNVRGTVVDDATKAIFKEMNTLSSTHDSVLAEVAGSAKEPNVAAIFAKHPPPEGAAEKGYEMAVGTVRRLEELQEQYARDAFANAAKGGFSVPQAENIANRIRTRFAPMVAEAKTHLSSIKMGDAASTHRAVDRMRGQIAREAKAFGLEVPNSKNQVIAERLASDVGEVYAGLREHLYDDAAWGAMGTVQRDTNAAIHAFINAEDYAFGKYASKTGETLLNNGAMRSHYRVNEGAIASLTNNLGKPAGRDRLASLMQYVDASEQLGTAIEKGYGSVAAKELKESAMRIRSVITDANVNMTGVEQAERLLSHQPQLHGITGTALEMAGVLGPAPAAAARVRFEVAALKTADKIHKAFAWIGKGTEKLPTAPRVRLPLGPFLGKNDPERALDKRLEMLQNAAVDNGVGVRDAVGSTFGDLNQHDPHAVGAVAASATRALEFLRANAPASTIASLTPKATDAKPSKADIIQFADLWDAIDDPVGVIGDVESGLVTDKQIEAIEHVYPQTLEYARVVAMQRLRMADLKGEQVPPRKRRALDQLLGYGGTSDTVFSDEFALAYPLSQPSQPSGGGAAKAPSNIANRYKTRTDEMIGAK
jgi:hypothetical protein